MSMLFHKNMNNYLSFISLLSVMISKDAKKAAGFGDFLQNLP